MPEVSNNENLNRAGFELQTNSLGSFAVEEEEEGESLKLTLLSDKRQACHGMAWHRLTWLGLAGSFGARYLL